jgi:hypothetical protein
MLRFQISNVCQLDSSDFQTKKFFNYGISGRHQKVSESKIFLESNEIKVRLAGLPVFEAEQVQVQLKIRLLWSS